MQLQIKKITPIFICLISAIFIVLWTRKEYINSLNPQLEKITQINEISELKRTQNNLETPQQLEPSSSPGITPQPSPRIDLAKNPILTPKQNPTDPEYYQIAELGIEFKLPSELHDLVYIYEPKIGAAYFSTAKLSKINEYCAPQHSPLGVFANVLKSTLTNNPTDGIKYVETIKSLTKERPIPGSKEMDPIMAKEFATNYIVYWGPQSPCVFDDKDRVNFEASSLQSFAKIIIDIREIK